MEQIIVTIITIIGGLVSLYFKQYFDQKKQRKVADKNAEKNLVLINSLKGDVGEIKKDLKIHISEEKDNNKIRQIILDKSLDIISANSDLSQEIKHLLISGHRALTDFAINYYNSTYRTNEREKLEYLKIVTDSINDKLKQIALQQFKTEKNFKGNEITFVEFIKQYTKIYVVIQVFIKTLVRNGLSHSDYMKVCEGFITDAFKEGIEGWRSWNNIK